MEAQLRVHQEFIPQADMLKFIQDKCDEYYLVLEADATRPHYQAYVKFKSKYENINSLRNQLKKLLTGKGNGAYSISELKKPPEHLVAYLMKEEGHIAHKVPKELLAKAEQVFEEFKQSKKRRDNRTILEQLTDEFPPRLNAYTQAEMVSTIIRYFHKNGKLQPDMYSLQKYIRTLCAQMDIDRYVRVAQHEYSDKFNTLEVMWKSPEFFSQD
jgi:hypothetical protein